MALMRWNPTREIMSAWNEFDRLFNRMLRSDDVDAERTEMSNIGTWRPAVDITEREKEYVLTVELPGINEDDVHIALKDNVLTLKGEKKFETEETEENRYYNERVFGSFQRMIRFDSEIKDDDVRADYENGVLTIILPKSEKTMHKQIPVKFKK